MKAPKLKDLNNVGEKDQFTKTVEVVQAKAAEMSKKTFTLDQQTIDVINGVALQMGQERGKVASASEAVRFIVSQYKGA